MTSIKIVRQLCDRCLPCACSLTVEQEQQIIRDLEVLEILKKLEWEVYENGGGDDWKWFIDTNQSMHITKEEAKKVKEWLENDSRRT